MALNRSTQDFLAARTYLERPVRGFTGNSQAVRAELRLHAKKGSRTEKVLRAKEGISLLKAAYNQVKSISAYKRVQVADIFSIRELSPGLAYAVRFGAQEQRGIDARCFSSLEGTILELDWKPTFAFVSVKDSALTKGSDWLSTNPSQLITVIGGAKQRPHGVQIRYRSINNGDVRENEPNIELSDLTVMPFFQMWRANIEDAKTRLASDTVRKGGAFLDISIKSPDLTDAKCILQKQIVSMIDALAMRRQEANLVGQYPISLKREFIPEVRNMLLSLFRLPADQRADFMNHIFDDIARAAKLNTVRGSWGSLRLVDDTIVLDVVPRKLREIATPEPHRALGWHPVSEELYD